MIVQIFFKKKKENLLCSNKFSINVIILKINNTINIIIS